MCLAKFIYFSSDNVNAVSFWLFWYIHVDAILFMPSPRLSHDGSHFCSSIPTNRHLAVVNVHSCKQLMVKRTDLHSQKLTRRCALSGKKSSSPGSRVSKEVVILSLANFNLLPAWRRCAGIGQPSGGTVSHAQKGRIV
ncbi:unnamed protein product [Protopolystoma xenopodis]|uniref:Uncharacterized protein n=1 Tax=Protopolystoma xenopodis TaxID=117903 RepID=A0A3S5BQR3_9PLAT|nr:unnamed protein product [Protopolystoma xenopodis]